MKHRLLLAIGLVLLTAALIAAQTSPEPTPTQPRPRGSIVLGADVYVRSGPGRDYGPVGHVVEGDQVVPLSRNMAGDWVLIRYHDGYGWIRRDLAHWVENIDALPILDVPNLTPSPVPGRETAIPFFPTETPAGNWVRAVSADSAYVRAGPGRTYLRVGQLYDGDLVEPVGRNADTSWVMIRFGDGFGWIARNLVRWHDDLERLPVLSEDHLTPTATFTATSTPTRTPTPTDTTTATETSTPTNTSTMTPSSTSSATETATQLPTATPMPTETATATLTETPSATATPTNTLTLTQTPIPATATPLPASIPSETPSPTETATETVEPTIAQIAVVPTDTPQLPTLTDTPAPTDTDTIAPTPTPSPTLTATATSSPTETVTPTPSATKTEQPASATHPAPSETDTPSAGALAATSVPTTEPTPPSAPVGTGGAGIPIEAIVGGVALVVVLAYVGLYWRGLAGVERYTRGFVVERCPVCHRGQLVVEARDERIFGIPRARRTIRCTACRSVLRETGHRRWRYAVDPLENPVLYERYNGREIDDETLKALAEMPAAPVEPPAPRSPTTPPSFVDDEDA